MGDRRLILGIQFHCFCYMTVTPYCKNLFQSRRDLHQFLSDCKQISLEKNHPQIISISLEIDPVDPLIIFHQIAKSNQLNFYVEKRELSSEIYSEINGNGSLKSISAVSGIAAIGSVASLQVKESDRFQAAKGFIHKTLANTIIAGDRRLPFSGPHFFCSFTFLMTAPNIILSFQRQPFFCQNGRFPIRRIGAPLLLIWRFMRNWSLNQL